jgi:YegS/Rv2252/BmrU family lipid kinase
MKQRKALLIYNPHAGRGRAAGRAREVARFCKILKTRGLKVEAAQTCAPHDATRLAARAAREDFTDIIVSGGDGTINEALQGVVGTKASFGVWPRGTANVLARELCLPFDVETAADVIARRVRRQIYLGLAESARSGERRYFFLMAGIGLDASVVSRVRPVLKRHAGEAAFWYSGLEHLALWKPMPFAVEVEGNEFPATFAAIGKAPRYGGGLAITPRARLEKAEFEICLIDSESRLRYLRLLAHALRGGVNFNAPDVRFLRVTRASVTGCNVPVQIDGELFGQLPMTFEIAPHAVEIITP